MEKRQGWICTDPDCVQFRREAPKKGEKVFELAMCEMLDWIWCLCI